MEDPLVMLWFVTGTDEEYTYVDETKFTGKSAASYENVPAVVNEGYVNEFPTEAEYDEVAAQVKPPHGVPNVTSTCKGNDVIQPYETLQHRKTWITRHKIVFAVILSVVLSVLISSAVFVTVILTTKSNEEPGK